MYPLDKAVTAKFKCVDKQSGIDTCTGTQSSGTNPLVSGTTKLDTSTLGSHSVTVTGKDKAGNVTVVTVHYTVVHKWSGFVSPITNESTGQLNRVHAGDLIKLKFGLAGETSLDVLASPPTSVSVACPAWPTHTIAAAPGTPPGLSYSPSKYTFGWQTSTSWAGTCRQFSLQLNDGTPPHTAVFIFYA